MLKEEYKKSKDSKDLKESKEKENRVDFALLAKVIDFEHSAAF